MGLYSLADVVLDDPPSAGKAAEQQDLAPRSGLVEGGLARCFEGRWTVHGVGLGMLSTACSSAAALQLLSETRRLSCFDLAGPPDTGGTLSVHRVKEGGREHIRVLQFSQVTLGLV
jgi:hypothetical protein